MENYFKTEFNHDGRGFFVKPYHSRSGFISKEMFCTQSAKGVARGLHYQFSQVEKCGATRSMTVLAGKILDFLVCFDQNTKKVITIEDQILGPNESCNSVFIDGSGSVCHGFIALEQSLCIYASSQAYEPEHDLGFNLFSIKYDFEKVLHQMNLPCFIRSERDQLLPSFN